LHRIERRRAHVALRHEQRYANRVALQHRPFDVDEMPTNRNNNNVQQKATQTQQTTLSPCPKRFDVLLPIDHSKHHLEQAF
jgi:hypothetical protein